MPELNDLQITGDWSTNAIVRMAKGNLGATKVLVNILNLGDRIDPDARNGGSLAILLLDRFEIYGEQIWVLHKSICGEDIVKTIALIRSAQMDLEEMTGEALKQAVQFVSQRIEITLDIDAVLKTVQERLPKLGEIMPKMA